MTSRLAERLRRFDAEVGLSEGDMVADALPHLPHTPMPTPTHIALVNLMDNVLGMAKSAAHEGGPGFTALAVAMRTMQKMRGTALEMLTTVPEEEVRAFMTQLGVMIRGVVNAGYELGPGVVTDGTGPGEPEFETQGAGPLGGGDPDGEVHAL